MDEGKQLEEAASRGYEAFCQAAAAFLPSLYQPNWSLLPESIRTAWKAAAKAIASSQ